MDKLPNLIAIGGNKGSGKDTAADWFVQCHAYRKMRFSSPMKEGIQVMFGLTDEQVNGEDRDKPIPWLSQQRPITPRTLLETLGTDWAQDMIDPEIWVHVMEQRIKSMPAIPRHDKIIIPDLRFDAQAEWVKSQGGIVIDIHSYQEKAYLFKVDDNGKREHIANGLDHYLNKHKSEDGISDNLVDLIFVNKKESLHDYHEHIANGLDDYLNSIKVEVDMSSVMSVKDLIVEWADKIYPDRTITNAIQKMVLEEIPEYLMAQDDAMELADIGILLYDIAHLAGVDLDEAIRKKMEININRDWEINTVTGLMNHTED